MPEKDPAHWLYRLTPTEWLAAANNELAAARSAFLQKQQRSAVAHARRAAGMAWNALLVVMPDEKYGRSYMQHLQVLSRDDTAPEPLRHAAARLVAMPLAQELVTLGSRGDASQADSAAAIIEHVQAQLMRLAPPAEA
jgi:hypothetical protein